MEDFQLDFKKLGKNENLLKFESLRKEALNSLPNFTNLNELPSYKESTNNETNLDFKEEMVSIKELDYFFTNSISRASKTMSECRQIKQNSKKNWHR